MEREVFPFPGKVKSSVWEYFGFYKDSGGSLDKSKAICKLCRRGVNYTGNTTNLRAHVVHHHRGEEGVDEKIMLTRVPLPPMCYSTPVTPTIPGFSLSAATPDKTKLRTFGENEGEGTSKPTMNSTLLNFIVGEFIPLEAVDSQAFKNLVSVFGNNKFELHVPKSNEINCILSTNYYVIKQKLAEYLTKAEAMFLKVEIWRTVKAFYMTVSVQILNEFWQSASYVLNTYDLGEKYTTKDVTDSLDKCIQEWSLADEIIVVSDDSQQVVDAASRLSCLHVTSLGVSLNKTAETCLEHPVVASVTSHVRSIVELFTPDKTASIILNEKQKVLQLPTKSLVMNERGSWASTLEMLDCFDEMSAAITATFNDPTLVLETKLKMLTGKEQSVVQSVVSMLRPLKTACSLSHSMKCASLSVVLPVLKKLEVALSSSDCDSAVMVDLKDKMLARLGRGYSDKTHRELLLLASLLDPRFKDLKFVDQPEQELAYTLLKQAANEVNNLMKADKEPAADSPSDCCIKIEINDDHEFSSCSSEEVTAVAALMDQLDQISKPPKRRRLTVPSKDDHEDSDPMNDWLADVVQEAVPAEKQEDAISNEISRFKSEMQIMSTSSPLSWWRDRLKTYPILSQVAKKYACAPAILTDREEAKQAVYERQRATLAEGTLDMMVFLNANMSITSC